MNTILSPQKGDPGDEQASSKGIQESITFYRQVKNITDGGEFLDDALRMKDQPYGETAAKENE